MCLTLSLTGDDHGNHNNTGKHERIIVDNTSVKWKEPVIFCTSFEKVIKQNLYIYVENRTDPSAPRNREVRRDFIGYKSIFYI
jgi:hypothetical protein